MALLAVLLLVTTPSIFAHSMIVYTNLPYTIYLVMGAIYLYFWLVRKEVRYLALSGLMTGLSTWTRSTEPFWLTNLIIVFAFFLYKRKPLAILLYLLFFLPIQQSWKIFESRTIGQLYSTAGQI